MKQVQCIHCAIFELLEIMTRRNVHCILSNVKSKVLSSVCMINLERGIKTAGKGSLMHAAFGPPLHQIRMGLGPVTHLTRDTESIEPVPL